MHLPLLPDADVLLHELPRLNLHRLGDDADAGLVQVSLPVPPVQSGVTGLGDGPTAIVPVGRWPGVEGDCPRRLLLTADAPAGAPESLQVSLGTPAAGGDCPAARMVQFAEYNEPGYKWESHYLELSHGGRRVGLAMGLRVRDEIHWWQACGLVVEDEQPFCRTIKMAGAIPVEMPTMASMRTYSTYTIPWLHNHNWINGDIHVRLYANGVCEIFAHHINSSFFDDGKTFDNVVPVVGVFSHVDGERGPAGPEAMDGTSLLGNWDGETTRFRIGDAALAAEEVGRLATEQYPGRFQALDEAAGLTVWQPYFAASMYGGIQPMDLYGTPWHVLPDHRTFLKGMARTLRFSLSLSDRSPRIARYLAPYWWYGATAEISAAPLLPVANAWDKRLDQATDWVREAIVKRGFEDGEVPRGSGKDTQFEIWGRHEPGWDGDVPYAMMLLAYRSGEGQDFQNALRASYYQSDVATDHAAGQCRMHGYPSGAYALPMNRMLGTLGAYMETADPYLLNIAEAVTDRSWRIQNNSWPRLAVGRDACFIRNAVFLWRYFANGHFRDIARRACHQVAQAQRPDGSVGDQGGGTGIHQSAAYVTKPWMAALGTSGVVEYLSCIERDETLVACVRKFADWLVANRWERDGVYGWSYEHAYDGKTEWDDPVSGKSGRFPSQGQWHHEQVAWILGYTAMETGDPVYMDAYLTSAATLEKCGGGHSVAAAAVCIPWLQARAYAARWTADGLATTPWLHDPRAGNPTVYTPDGPKPLA